MRKLQHLKEREELVDESSAGALATHQVVDAHGGYDTRIQGDAVTFKLEPLRAGAALHVVDWVPGAAALFVTDIGYDERICGRAACSRDIRTLDDLRDALDDLRRNGSRAGMWEQEQPAAGRFLMNDTSRGRKEKTAAGAEDEKK